MAQRRKTKTVTTVDEEEEEEKTHILPTDLQSELIPIHTDLLTDILSILPVTCLLKFSLVCKAWRQLISSPRFIQIHLNMSKERSSGSRIFTSGPFGFIDYGDDDIVKDNSVHKIISKKIPYPPGFSDNHVRILGSCDGLICLLDEGNMKISVINPSTRKLKSRQFINFSSIDICWFGHLPLSTGEHVLVTGSHKSPDRNINFLYGESDEKDDCNSIQVYKLNQSLFVVHQQVKFGRDYYIYFEMIGTLLHGTLHWPAYIGSRYVVFAYDFQKNEIFEIPAPPAAESPFTLGVVDGCLFGIAKPRTGKVFEFWIMWEYGVKESWTKYANIEGYDGDHYNVLVPLGFSCNGELILRDERSMLTKYRFGDKAGTALKTPICSEAIVYTDSLVPPS